MKSGNVGIARSLDAMLFPSRKREGVGSGWKRNNYLSPHRFNRILGLKEFWLTGPHYTPSFTPSANVHTQISNAHLTKA